MIHNDAPLKRPRYDGGNGNNHAGVQLSDGFLYQGGSILSVSVHIMMPTPPYLSHVHG